MLRGSSDQSPAHWAPWIPYIVLLVASGITVIATVYVSREAAARDSFRFRSAVEDAHNDITARLDTYIGYLRAGAGFFAANEHVTRQQWRAFVDRLEIPQYSPGLQGLGFTRRLTSPAEMKAALEELRENVAPTINFYPDHDDDERHAIIYLEPENERNLRAIGYDMFSQPTRREAMLRARDEAQPVASGKVRLVQELEDTDAQAGFLIYVPVYRTGTAPAKVEDRREQLVGFVYSPFRMDDLIMGTFRDHINATVRFDIYDGEVKQSNLLHLSPADVGYYPRLTMRREVMIAGRPWQVVFSSLPRFDVEAGRDLTPFVLIAGATLSLVLFLLTRSQYSARRAAERIAQDLRASEFALRLSESRFRRLAESNLIGVVFCDMQGRISRGNLEFFRLVGYDREEVLSGRVRMDTLTAPEYRAADAVALAQLRAVGVAEPYEKELVRHDGNRVPVLIGLAMLQASTTECVAFCIDLSPSKQAAKELQRAKEQAESANRAKDQFLAVLSHELRTPLTPVLAVATAAEGDQTLPQQARADFAMIRRNIELEAKLIDDLLDLTRIGRGKIHLHLDTLDAHQVIQHAINVCSSDEIAMKRLRIAVDLAAEKHHVRGDAARLQQVFWNLLKNAVKFTPGGGLIRVSTYNDGAGRLLASIADSGVGIEPELLPRIFDAFEQGELAVMRNFGGLGLGLAISKGLVLAHGGSIAAHSEGRDRGATFTVTLDTVPYTAPIVVAPVQPAAEPRSKLSILLVEDHADTARALKRLLDASGYNVSAADSVQSALHLAAQTDFDVLVSDLGLPDGSGLDIMRHLRDTRNGRVPAGIALTGYGMEDDVARSRDAGFAEHITKPVNFDNLQDAIKRVTVAN